MFTQSVKLEKKSFFKVYYYMQYLKSKIVFITQENYILKSIDIDNYSYVFYCSFQENVLRQIKFILQQKKIGCIVHYFFLLLKFFSDNVPAKFQFLGVLYFVLFFKYLLVLLFRVLFFITCWHWQNIHTINSR